MEMMQKKLIFIFTLLLVVSVYSQTVPEKFSAGMEKYEQGRYADSYTLFKSAAENYGIEDELYASALYYAAQSLIKLGEKDEAAAELEFIVNNINWSNFREEAYYYLGLIYFDYKKFSIARARFESLLEEFPGRKFSGSALYWIGESYAAEDKLDDAIEFLLKAVDDKANNNFRDYSIYTLATVYEKKGDYENAVKYYDRLLSYYRDSPLLVSAQIRIGICYFYLKDYQSSILELNNPLLSNLSPELYSESLYLLANSYYRVEEYENAERIYTRLIKEYPSNKVMRDAQYGLGWSFFQQEKYNDAYRVFNFLSAEDDSTGIESFFWKAEARRYAGKDEEALIIYKQFLEKYPASNIIPRVKYQLGLLYFNKNNIELAKRYLIPAASGKDNTVRAKAYTLLGEIELDKKQYVFAENYFEPVLGISDNTTDTFHRALLGLAVSLYYLENYSAALEYLNELMALSPGFERDRVNYYLAEIYFAKENYKEALLRFKAIETESEEIKRLALYGKAYCYFNLGDYDNAALQFSEFLRIYPNDKRSVDAKLRLADSYFGSKNFTASSKVYRDLFSSKGLPLDDPYAYYQFAQALYKSGKNEKAIKEFTNLQKKFPKSSYADVSLYTIGWIHFQNSEFSRAIDEYRSVLQTYKSTSLGPIVYYSIGDAFFNMGKYDSAIVNYKMVLTNYPSSQFIFDAVNGIQYSYVALNKPESAVDLIDAFIAQNPSLNFSDQIFFKKGEIYYSEKNYEKAKESYKDFIAKFPDSKLVPEAYYWIGKSAENLEKYEEAIFYFNTTFQKYPKNEIAASAVLEMGSIHNKLENYSGAISTYDEALEKLKGSSSIPEIMFMKGQTYIKMDSLQQAYEVFSDVSYYYRETIFADNSKIEMGTIDLAAGRYENAEQYFLDIAEKRSDNLGAKAQYFYGLSLFEDGKVTEAISALVRVRTVFSSYDEWLTRSYMLLGDCYVKLNDKQKAEEMYRTVIRKHKNDDFGKEAMDKIRNLK